MHPGGPHVAAHPYRTQLALGGQQPARDQRPPTERDGDAGFWGQYAPAIAPLGTHDQPSGTGADHDWPQRRHDPQPHLPRVDDGPTHRPVPAVPDLERRNQLRLLGNGVVPQQAAPARLLDELATEHVDGGR